MVPFDGDSGWLRDALRRRVGIDVRALAALRIALGGLLLGDLLVRSQDLVAHYTDTGVLPRATLHDVFPGFARLSIHTLGGTAWIQGLLFLLAGLCALALVFGYRTRLATICSFLLLLSLHARNPLVLNAGDSLLRRLLFWGIFLPLGGRWSIDACRSDDTHGVVVRLAAVALLLQVVLVYVVNGLLKLRGDTWIHGEAVEIIFGLDHLTILLGDTVARFPALLGVLDRVWLVMTLSAVLLLVLRGRRRIALVSLFAGAHLGMFLTMRLGLFPLISIAGLLPFLPPSIWDRIDRVVPRSRPHSRWIDRRDRMLPVVPSGLSEWSNAASRVRPAVVAVLLAVVLIWNAASLGVVDLPRAIESTADPEERRWDMFAPEPRSTDGWYVIVGMLESGNRVDAFHGGSVSWDRPPDLASTFPTHRWFLYLLDLAGPGSAELREDFADYLCHRWDVSHESDLASLTIYYIAEQVRLDTRDTTVRRDLGEFTCGNLR